MFDALVPEARASAAQVHLQREGVQRGDIVAWLGYNSWDLLATLVACERQGAVLMPLNWRLAGPELVHQLAHSGASHLLGTLELAPLAAELRQRVSLASVPAPDVLDDDLLLVYTSGTTGAPKAAMHTRQGLQANVLAAVAAQGLDAQSRVLAVLPMFHVGGLCIQTLPALAVGAQVSIHPRFEAEAWFDAVAQWRPTTTLLVPAVMRALIEHPRWAQADLSSLQFINSGSQIVPLALIQAFHDRGIPVAQVYGATETGPVSIVLPPGEAMAHAGMAGRAALGVQVRLLADGEICLKAPQLMRAYHRSAEPGFDSEGWFHTGDLARLHDNGLYEVVGRSKELIISGGENIHPAEIEQLAAALPGVAQCAVVGVADVRWGEVPVLVVVRQANPVGAALTEQSLLQALSPRLARFKRPSKVVFMASLPSTALGKVARGELRDALVASG